MLRLLFALFCSVVISSAIGVETPPVVKPESGLFSELTRLDTTQLTMEVQDQLTRIEAKIDEQVATAPDAPETALLVGILASQQAWSNAGNLTTKDIAPEVSERALAWLVTATGKALPSLDRYLAQAGATPHWQALRHRARCLALQKTAPGEVEKIYLEAWKAGSAMTDAGVEQAIIDDLCRLRSVSESWSESRFYNTPFRLRVLLRELVARPGVYNEIPKHQLAGNRRSPLREADDILKELEGGRDPADGDRYLAVIRWLEECDLRLTKDGATPLSLFTKGSPLSDPALIAPVAASALPEAAFEVSMTNQYGIERIMHGLSSRTAAFAGMIARQDPADPRILLMWRHLLATLEGYQRAQILRLWTKTDGNLSDDDFRHLVNGTFHERLTQAHKGILTQLLAGRDWQAMHEALVAAENHGLTLYRSDRFAFTDVDTSDSLVLTCWAQTCIDVCTDVFVARRDDPTQPLDAAVADRQQSTLVGLQRTYGFDREPFPFLHDGEEEARKSYRHPLILDGKRQEAERERFIRTRPVRVMLTGLAGKADSLRLWLRQAPDAEEHYLGHLLALVTGDRAQLAKILVAQKSDSKPDYLAEHLVTEREKELSQAKALLDWIDGKAAFPWDKRWNDPDPQKETPQWADAVTAIANFKEAEWRCRYRMSLVDWAIKERRYADAQVQLKELVDSLTGWDLLRDPRVAEAIFLQRSGALALVAGADARRQADEARRKAEDKKDDDKKYDKKSGTEKKK